MHYIEMEPCRKPWMLHTTATDTMIPRPAAGHLDPIAERGGVNLYGFVGNNGVNSLDYLGLKGNGHHLVPWSLFEGKVNKEVKDFFDSDAARIFNDYYKNHTTKTLRGITHPEYTKLVKESLDKFLGNQAIKDMTTAQAEVFLNQIKNAPPGSAIGRFNAGVAEEAAQAMKRGLKMAAEKAAKESLDAALSRGAKQIAENGGRKAGPLGLAVDVALTVGEARGNNVTILQQVEQNFQEEAEFSALISPTFWIGTGTNTVINAASNKLQEWGAHICD